MHKEFIIVISVTVRAVLQSNGHFGETSLTHGQQVDSFAALTCTNSGDFSLYRASPITLSKELAIVTTPVDTFWHGRILARTTQTWLEPRTKLCPFPMSCGPCPRFLVLLSGPQNVLLYTLQGRPLDKKNLPPNLHPQSTLTWTWDPALGCESKQHDCTTPGNVIIFN